MGPWIPKPLDALTLHPSSSCMVLQEPASQAFCAPLKPPESSRRENMNKRYDDLGFRDLTKSKCKIARKPDKSADMARPKTQNPTQ